MGSCEVSVTAANEVSATLPAAVSGAEPALHDVIINTAEAVMRAAAFLFMGPPWGAKSLNNESIISYLAC